MNQHVYLYYRWKYWVAMRTGRLLAATFFAQWAQDEETAQCRQDLNQ